MSQITGGPRRTQHLLFEYKASGSGCSWTLWISIFLAILGLVLTVVIGKGWL